MAEYALLRAMNHNTCTIIGIPQRVTSKNIVDKMEAIPEDGGSSGHSSINGDVESVVKASASVAMLSKSHSYSEKSPLLAKRQRQSTDEKLRKAITALLSILAVGSSTMQTISIPLYVHSMTTSRAGSDPYVASFLAAMWPPAIFFVLGLGIHSAPGRTEVTCGPPAPVPHLFLAGMLAGLNTILIAATSLPERTPTYLQSILSHSMIPFSAICRAVILRKGVTRGQGVCILILFIGIFISLEPSIFNIRKEPRPSGWGTTLDLDAGAWYYYLIYGLAWLPLALCYVLMEKSSEFKGRDIAYTGYIQFFVFISHGVFVFLDFIPKIGLANYGQTNFWTKLANGFQCFYGVRAECSDVPRYAIMYVASFTATNVFSILLIRHVKGAVYTTVVLSLVTPISTLFWNIFTPVPNVHFNPFFDLATVFVIVGLCVMTPAVAMYAYFNPAPKVVLDVRAGEDEDNLPIRYHTGRPRIKRIRSWSVTYIDTSKRHSGRPRSASDIPRPSARSRSGSDVTQSSDSDGTSSSRKPQAQRRTRAKRVRRTHLRHSKSAPVIYNCSL